MSRRSVLLWINLTVSERTPKLPSGADRYFSIHFVRAADQIAVMMRSVRPDVLCFEYDYPTDGGLNVLSQIKRDYPDVAVILLTGYHSATLAVWALRARVWDYIVKPFSIELLLRSVAALSAARRRQGSRLAARHIILPPRGDEHVHELTTNQKTIMRAQSYVLQNLSEPIRLREVADYCYVSHAHLSRMFKEVRNISFKQFLLQARIAKAAELLADPSVTVTDISYAVGFRDTSHFGRVFRRYVGMTPSAYRRSLIESTGVTVRQMRRASDWVAHP